MNKIRIFSKTILVIFSSFGAVSNAAIINMTDGTLDYNYDDATGLDWLDLTHTDDLSYNEVTTKFAGWSIATESVWRDMYAYYDNTDADGTVFGYEQTSSYSGTESARGYDLELPAEYFNDFGFTSKSSIVAGGKGNNTPDYLSTSSLGFMLNDVDNGFNTDDDLRIGGMGGQIYQDDYAHAQDSVFNEFDRTSDHGYYMHKYADTATNIGWYLVRQHEQQPLPEPSILGLMSLGLLGIGFVRRCKVQP